MMFWTIEKLQARIRELDGFRYRDLLQLKDLRMKEDQAGANGEYPTEEGPWLAVRVGDRWKGRDVYRWLAADVRLPAAWQGRPVVGLFDFGQTGGGGNSGFESLLFVNGSPFQGVDTNHREVFLPAPSEGAEGMLRLRFRLWSGLGGYNSGSTQEHRLQTASIGWLDELTDDLYYTSRAATETAAALDESRPERHDLLAAVDRAFRLLDWSRPGSEAFYASVQEAQQHLRGELQRMPKAAHAITIRCIGHTHIDVAWLWRLRHTREKAARSFSTVLRLMERFPEYIFLQTQPQLYEYIKMDYPELYVRIRERVAEGRWEAGGAMWLEADCNLTSGESLVRQLLYGIQFFQKEFGVTCDYLWLPDVFGYSWALPQILRKAGIKAFMTTKISWNQYNRMPHDTFRWRGIDGSEVLTHFITTTDAGGIGQGGGSYFYTYNGAVTPKSVLGSWDAYRDKEFNRELLLSYGYGDGGGGVNREMLELRRRLAELPGLPNVTTGRADSYFRELEQRVSETDAYVHTWDGELYLELHRGTYTSQAYNKKMNRKLELFYRETEWLCVTAALLQEDPSAYRREALYEGWKIILRNQFHDIIPGSSIHEVYEDCRVEYAEAERLGEEAKQAALERLTEADVKAEEITLPAHRDPTSPISGMDQPVQQDAAGPSDCLHACEQSRFRWTIYNSANWSRTDLVRVPTPPGLPDGVWTGVDGQPPVAQNTDGVDGVWTGADGVWTDADDRPLAAQHTDGAWWVLAEIVPSMGWLTIGFEAREPEAASVAAASSATVAVDPFHVDHNGLETPHYSIRWNECGQLTRLWDKAAVREVLPKGGMANVLQVFEDKPKGRHEAWDIDLFYQEKMRLVQNLRSVSVTETGPLRAVVEFEWAYGDSIIRQRMIAYEHSRRLDFETVVDWQEQRQLLKVAFPVEIRATEATYDIQFGNVKRPTHWNTSWDYARFETVGHQWADLSEAGYGVSLLNDCKYGYDIKDNVLRLSLIKSARVPDPQADLGEHRFTYALLPHAGDWREAGTVQEAWSLNNRLGVASGRAVGSETFSLLRVSAPERILIDAVKQAEDEEAVIIRLHEYAGSRGLIQLDSDLPIVEWTETDLLERTLGGSPQTESVIQFQVRPYEIRTFRVRFGTKE